MPVSDNGARHQMQTHGDIPATATVVLLPPFDLLELYEHGR